MQKCTCEKVYNDIKHINRGDCRSLIACKTNARIHAKLLF